MDNPANLAPVASTDTPVGRLDDAVNFFVISMSSVPDAFNPISFNCAAV